jgi:hypothetical protein
MDRLTEGAAVAAFLVSLTLSLAACGGGSGASGTVPVASPPPAPSAQSVDGVTTPASVSVVTAKNAN